MRAWAVSQDTAERLEGAIGPDDIRLDIARLDAIDGQPVAALVVDLALATGREQELLRYRYARAETRLIIIAWEATPPGSDALRRVVAGARPHAVATSRAELEAALQGDGTELATAMRWGGDAPVGGASTTITVEKVRRVPMSERPVVIAVAGIAGGVGTSSVVMAMARCIEAEGHGVVVGEVGTCGLEWPAQATPELGVRVGARIWLESDRWPTEMADLDREGDWRVAMAALDAARKRGAGYVVLDMGALGDAGAYWPVHSVQALWQRARLLADRTFLVGPGSDLRAPIWRRWELSLARHRLAPEAAEATTKGRPAEVVAHIETARQIVTMAPHLPTPSMYLAPGATQDHAAMLDSTLRLDDVPVKALGPLPQKGAMAGVRDALADVLPDLAEKPGGLFARWRGRRQHG